MRTAATGGAVSPVDVAIGVLVLVALADRRQRAVLKKGDYDFEGGLTGILTAYLQEKIGAYPQPWQPEILKLRSFRRRVTVFGKAIFEVDRACR